MKIKEKFKPYLCCIMIIGFVQAHYLVLAQSVTLKKKWETQAKFKEPESVIYDKNNKVLYVSNINSSPGGKDGNGFISRISLNGEIEDLEWVQGLDDPKGLGLYNGLLYVADITNVKVINIASAEVVKVIELEDAGKLNDVTVDEGGAVYISDPVRKRIYIIKDNRSENWLENDVFKRLNGVLASNNKLYTIDMDLGILYEIDKKTKALLQIAEGLKGGDGIVPYKDGFIVSNWYGEIYVVSANGQIEKLLDTKAEKVNAADIEFIPELNLLLVPTFYKNTIAAYEVE